MEHIICDRKAVGGQNQVMVVYRPMVIVFHQRLVLDMKHPSLMTWTMEIVKLTEQPYDPFPPKQRLIYIGIFQIPPEVVDPAVRIDQGHLCTI